MKCVICGEDNDAIAHCICGYCQNCLDKYGHEGCRKMEREKKT
jgi:hypothetical protein